MRRLQRLLVWWTLAGACAVQGCIFEDPDVRLRSGLSLASDVAIFLLENAAAGL